MEEILLLIQDQTFRVKKQVLCEHSDYFRAMFSGNYAEEEQQEIAIDVVDPNSMNLILRYMELGLIDLTDYDLSTLGELATAANFLQITELIKQIEYTLDAQLSVKNWVEIMTIAENSAYTNLEKLCASFGLYSFKYMKPEYIPTMHKLLWYLSHPYLDAQSEFNVFKFGLEWMSQFGPGISSETILVILSCLDLQQIQREDAIEAARLVLDHRLSVGGSIVECLVFLLSKGQISLSAAVNFKDTLITVYNEAIYNELVNVIKECKFRKLIYTPVVPVWLIRDSKLIEAPHSMYTFKEHVGFEKWLEVAEQNLWGWNVTAWGPTKLVAVCGEYGRGTGIFMKDVKVYDTLREEWINHGVQLPPRRHAGVTTVRNSLFLIGGVGGFRVVLDTAIIYNLKYRTFRKIAKFPDAIQNPGVCTHNEKVYAAGQKNIYQYEDTGDTDRWTAITNTDIRINTMISFRSHIYCAQNFFSNFFRFRPGVDEKIEMARYFSNPPTAVCSLGDRLLFFTRTVCGHTDHIMDVLSVEEYTNMDSDKEATRIIWSQKQAPFRINDVAGSCSLVMSVAPVSTELNAYQKQFLKNNNPELT